MHDVKPPLLTDTAPELARALEAGLRSQGEEPLAERVASLRITHRCECDEESCASFWTTEWFMKRWFRRGRQIEIPGDFPGAVAVDVIDGEIVYVEVLFWPEARAALGRAVP